LTDHFDYDKVTLKQKARIRELLLMANRVLVSLGVGYFHQIYRRALYCELKAAQIEFEVMKQVTATYYNRMVGSREVNFFKIGDLLASAVAVQAVDDMMLIKFRNYLKHLHCRHGVLFNFNATVLDSRYLEL
jgi:GxxExxY protein